MFWGIMDVTYISWYIIESIQSGNAPYYTDVISSFRILSSHGGVISHVWTLLSWTLEFSIMVSGVVLLFGHRMARPICYIQIPFRICFATPSITLMLMAFSFLGSPGFVLALVLLLASEAIKAFTLWKFGNVPAKGYRSVHDRGNAIWRFGLAEKHPRRRRRGGCGSDDERGVRLRLGQAVLPPRFRLDRRRVS